MGLYDPHEVSIFLMSAVRELEADGLIEIRPNPKLGEIPRYWVAEKGRPLLTQD